MVNRCNSVPFTAKMVFIKNLLIFFKHNNKHKRGFKIAHLNIRSLIAHIEEFRIYIKTRNFDIISINETMLDYTISDHEISVPGCDFVQNDRHRNGGGVVLYIRNSINFKIRHDLMMDSLELSVEIFKPKVKSLIINTWYRPPNALIDIFDDFELCIQKMDTEDKEIIFIGDFNCDWTLPLEQ